MNSTGSSAKAPLNDPRLPSRDGRTWRKMRAEARVILRTIFIMSLTVSIWSCSGRDAGRKPIIMDELMIQVFDTTRDVAYTNKQAGYYYTETNAPHHTSWQGWHIMQAKMLDDYQVLINGKPLDRREVQITQVFPHQFVRVYKIGLRETVTMLDSVNAIVVELDRIKSKHIDVRPLFSQPVESYTSVSSGGSLLTAALSHRTRTEKENFPVWVGVSLSASNAAIDTVHGKSGAYTYTGTIGADVADERAVIILASGDTEADATTLAEQVKTRYPSLIAARKARMEKLLNDSYVRTNEERLTKALNWAKISLDALMMNQVKKGIFAGLPWFDNYWGRDSYISLPGAAIVDGKFTEAKEILRSFADWQDHDFESPTAGRIPNLVTTVSMAYNTTDGTPWFCNALEMYVKYSNDTAFAREMYPTVFMAIEGALKHHVDSLSLMTHLDAETWMDAVGPEGPWSPRGNRANDIQWLWYREMQSAIALAQFAGDNSAAAKWNGIIRNIDESFNKQFINKGSGFIADHLNIDGSADTLMRPNQLFALPLVDDPVIRAKAFRRVTEELVYPWGIASLSQEDNNFHPYHHYAPYYVQDAAYHNGTVWTWLYGRWVDAAAAYQQQQIAYTVTTDMVHQILDRGAVGTLSELTDALPRPGKSEPELSGTFSQAWSLAEFNRSWIQGYLGAAVDAGVPRITLSPRIPKELNDVEFTIPIREFRVAASYRFQNGIGTIHLELPSGAPEIDLRLSLPLADGLTHITGTALKPGKPLTITVGDSKISRVENGVSSDLDAGITEKPLPAEIFTGMKLAAPHLRENLPALKGPDYAVLHQAEIKADDSKAVTVFDGTDPAGDDNGDGHYVYPANVNLKPGSLDITRFTVKADDANAFFTLTFRNLSNPGWHPEYGFQLTYAVIAIDEDGNPGSGSTDPGMNALYRIDPSRAFEHVIYVGGGFRLADSKGKTLAEYLPAPGDISNPLGNTDTKTVSFSIPAKLLGKPLSSWNYTILVGAQDDHGGAGVGDFRGVTAVAQEWSGGGKKNASAPNVYDVMFGGK